MKRDKIDEFRVNAVLAHLEHLARRIPLGTTDYTPWQDELDFIVRVFKNSEPAKKKGRPNSDIRDKFLYDKAMELISVDDSISFETACRNIIETTPGADKHFGPNLTYDAFRKIRKKQQGKQA
ncbi:MAG: hypothetical protein ABJI96_10315 [Paracoccaceae bacterium]